MSAVMTSAADAVDAREIAVALGVTKRAVELRAVREGWPYHDVAVRGGKRRLYPVVKLPSRVQAALLMKCAPALPSLDLDADDLPRRREPPTQAVIESAWARYERAAQKSKDTANVRLRALLSLRSLKEAGTPRVQAAQLVAAQLRKDNVRGGSPASLWRWEKDLEAVPRQHWLAFLLPEYPGRTVTAECHEEAWAQLKALYLSPRAPNFRLCCERVRKTALVHGWAMPSEVTLARRMDKEVPHAQQVFLREGAEALERLYPPQQRDRSMFEALEAVNGDGILFVPWCVWPTGELARPKVWVWQCLGTGKILAWRGDVSENTDMLRLAFGDLVEQWALPRVAVLDNTMAAANTTMTAGVKNRYRFPVKDENIVGILPQCGVEVRFTKPAHGQSKPIERAFRDLRERIDRHPAYGKRGTKDNPLLYAEWLEIFEREIAAHNAQQGRRGAHFAGRSFDQVFAESYARTTVRRATAEQRRLWLLAADKVTVNRAHGYVVLGRGPQGENRYFCDALHEHLGQKVVVRFDPQKLQANVYVYTLSGAFIGEAECTWKAGFLDTEAGRAYARALGHFNKATKAAARAQLTMDELTAIRMVPDTPSVDLPQPAAIAPMFRSAQPSPMHAHEPLRATGTDGPSALDELMLARARRQKEQAL